MASITTNKLRQLLLNTGINLLTDTIKVILINSSYTPDPDHDFVNSVTDTTSKELSGTGYVAGFAGSGRKTLASKTVTKDNTNNVAYVDAADVTWSGINAGTVGYIGVIKEVTTDADSPLLCVIDVADTVTNGGDLTAQWAAADGLFKIA